MDEFAKAREKALVYLTDMDRTEQELRKKLLYLVLADQADPERKRVVDIHRLHRFRDRHESNGRWIPARAHRRGGDVFSDFLIVFRYAQQTRVKG